MIFPTKRLLTISLFLIPYSILTAQTQKILFDATKAEMAGNADWVIDADVHNIGTGANGAMTVGAGNESNPQRIPTPAQSQITASTLETFWQGSLSAWGVGLVKEGFVVETLPIGASITYGVSTNPQDLSNYTVYVVDEPNILFTASEKTAIMNFVKNGGGLFMISDHTVSDRNNDGADSPQIWNDLMTNNTVQNNPFGFSFDLQNFSLTSNNYANIATDSILHGAKGTPIEVQWANGTSMTLDPTKNNSVRGLFYKTGSTTTGNVDVLVARANYGKGKIFAMGDSSPADDGTGDPNDNLYNGWSSDAHGNHAPLILNATLWLAHKSSLTATQNTTEKTFEVYPNPTTDVLFLETEHPENLILVDVLGREIKHGVKNEFSWSIENLPSAIYFISDVTTRSFIKIVKDK